jgi:hypothetical protein
MKQTLLLHTKGMMLVNGVRQVVGSLELRFDIIPTLRDSRLYMTNSSHAISIPPFVDCALQMV